MPKSTRTRIEIPQNIDSLVKLLAELKNSGKDWTLKDVAEEAMTDWLCKPENIALIKKHKLAEALETKGLSLPNTVKECIDF